MGTSLNPKLQPLTLRTQNQLSGTWTPAPGPWLASLSCKMKHGQFPKSRAQMLPRQVLNKEGILNPDKYPHPSEFNRCFLRSLKAQETINLSFRTRNAWHYMLCPLLCVLSIAILSVVPAFVLLGDCNNNRIYNVRVKADNKNVTKHAKPRLR